MSRLILRKAFLRKKAEALSNFYFLKTVNTQEFETQYQESVSKILNDLQSMAIISNRLESSIVEVGTSVQNLNKMVEDYMKSQAEKDTENSRTSEN